MFTVLLFNTVRGLNHSSLSYYVFNFDPNYIIQRYSFLFFLQNIIFTIITCYNQFVKTRVFICIKSFYWSFSLLSLHRFIITALLCFNNIMVFQLCLCFNCGIRIKFLSWTFVSYTFLVITVIRSLLIVSSTSLVSWTRLCSRSVTISTRSSSALSYLILIIFDFVEFFYLISFISFWFF